MAPVEGFILKRDYLPRTLVYAVQNENERGSEREMSRDRGCTGEGDVYYEDETQAEV